MTPLVAVCLPVYNASAYLGEAIESVLAQDFERWEMVIVDDCSTDGSADIAATYAAVDPRISFHRNDTNLGSAVTWNHAVARSTAPYVKLLCNDDVIKPACLSRQVAVFEADRDHRLGLVTARRDIVAADGSPLHRNHGLRGLPRRRDVVGHRELVLSLLRNGGNPVGEPSTVLLRREALDAVGGFPSDWQYVIDLATYVEISRTYDVAILRDSLATFRVGDTSWSATLARRQAAETRRLMRQLSSEGDIGRWRRWQGYAMAQAMQEIRRGATFVSRQRARRR